MDTRETALLLFVEMEKTKNFGSSLIRDTLNKYDYEDPREKAFLKRLTEGTLESLLTLDYVINAYSKTPTNKMKPLIRSLLRLSVYQILYMDTVPDSAACNEAVRLAKKKGFERLSGFVNGVLRTITRNKEEILNSESAFWQELQKNPVQALSVRYSVPEWMISLWEAQYGEEKTEPMLERLKNGRPLTIRLDSRLTEEEKAQEIAAIEVAGVTVQKHQLYADAWNLEGCEGIGHLPGFAEGLFYAQDVSSMLAVEAAGISGGMTVMDLCSAPGGKTTLAARKAGSGKVICGDVSERKAALILENTDRMKCSNGSVNVWDASVFMEQYKESADVVLLDVPCSGLGVIGRKKEIRYRVTKEDLAALVTLQKKIVDACWQYVKPGGLLCYSTCTIDRLENQDNAAWLRERFPLVPVDLTDRFGGLPQESSLKEGWIQFLPGVHPYDGFFISVFRRAEGESGPDGI